MKSVMTETQQTVMVVQRPVLSNRAGTVPKNRVKLFVVMAFKQAQKNPMMAKMTTAIRPPMRAEQTVPSLFVAIMCRIPVRPVMMGTLSSRLSDYGEDACTVCGTTCTLVPGVTSLCGDGVVQGTRRV